MPRHILLCLAVLVVGGCGSKKDDEDAPTTYTVNGRVKFRDGNPYPGGSIEMRSVKPDEQYRMTGRISQDGAFSLKTVGGNSPIDGGMAGEFQVTLIPDMGEDQTNVKLRPMTLKSTYKIEPRDNFDLNIIVDQAKPR